MQLPKIVNNDSTLQLMQTKWASILNPLLAQPLSSSSILNSVSLVTGNNTINHLLGRTQQGWILCDQTASASIYRSAPFNSITLTLNASAPCIVDLLVF
jgi:hypothetical protein